MTNIQSQIPLQHESLAYMRQHYDNAVASGLKRPLLFPHGLFSLVILAAFLLTDHRQSHFIYNLRWPVWFTIIALEVSNIRNRIAVDPAMSYVFGVVSIWCIVWSSVWLIFNRPQFTAKRIRRRRKTFQNRTEIYPKGSTRQTIEISAHKINGNGHSVQTLELRNRHAATVAAADKSVPEVKDSDEDWEYYWQSYPSSFGERLRWVIDLILSFRGHGWNFAIPTNPPIPREVASALGDTVPKTDSCLTSRSGIKCFRTRKELARYAIPVFILCYVILDFGKLQIIHDPFFRTGDDTLPPPVYLEGLPPPLVTCIRRNTIIIALVAIIEFHALLLPIFFSLILGPRVIGIRGEPWMYATTWGSFSTIFNNGLSGFWGSWWHQTFRFGFTAPTNYLICHGWLRRNSIASKLISLTIAFVISGTMHTTGSFMQVLPTRPTRQLIFFLIQIPAVVVQVVSCAVLRTWLDRLPIWIRQAGNGLITYLWLYRTCQLFMDDMSAGGSWMYEPVMVSALRLLGLGPEGYGWWTWGHVDLKWHCGGHWWESGIGGF